MQPIHILDIVKVRIVACSRDDGYPASPVCTTTDEDVIVIFKQIVRDNEEKCVGVGWEDVDSEVDDIVETELSGKDTIWRGRASADLSFRGLCA